MILVHPIGSKVTLHSDIEAVVAKVAISQAGVSYLLVWWDERKRVEEWVYEFEVTPIQPQLQVGFH